MKRGEARRLAELAVTRALEAALGELAPHVPAALVNGAKRDGEYAAKPYLDALIVAGSVRR